VRGQGRQAGHRPRGSDWQRQPVYRLGVVAGQGRTVTRYLQLAFEPGRLAAARRPRVGVSARVAPRPGAHAVGLGRMAGATGAVCLLRVGGPAGTPAPLGFIPGISGSQTPFGNLFTKLRFVSTSVLSARETEFREMRSQTEFGNEKK